MAYTWTNGEVITAEKLNQTGGGGGSVMIVDVTITTGSHSEKIYTLGKTWQEIYDAYMSGSLVLLHSGDVETSATYETVVTVSYSLIDADNPFYEVAISAQYGATNFSCSSASEYPSYTSI